MSDIIKFSNNELRIRNLNFKIDASVSFTSGDFVRFYGINGVGKTTFFQAICEPKPAKLFSFRRVTERYVTFDKDLDYFYVPQNYESYIYSGRSVANFVEGFISQQGKITADKASAIFKSFYSKHQKLFELNYKIYKKERNIPLTYEKFLKLRMNNLSGGQKRLLYIVRIALLLSLNNKSNPLIILDEPFNDLDQANKKFALDLIDEMRSEYKSLIIFIITHMPIVGGLTKIIRLIPKDNDVIVFDDTKNSSNLLKKCECLFEEE